MSIKKLDPVMSMQIWTVPQLKEDYSDNKDNKYDEEEQSHTNEELDNLHSDETPRNSDDDYSDYINQEVNILNS